MYRAFHNRHPVRNTAPVVWRGSSMRLRLEITTAADELPWRRVLAPGRGVAYALLAFADPDLGNELHESGWGPHGMVPFGYGAPGFPAAPRRRGAYAAGGPGVVEFGSPLPAVVEAWTRALRHRELLDWGGTAFRVTGLRTVAAPKFASGRATMRTETPVVMKAGDSRPVGSTPWVLPTDAEFPAYFLRNLRRKAETLGLAADLGLDAVTWVGPQRSFAVGGGAKPGAPVEVRLSGEPETLRAIWSWGLGQANAAGFGWVGSGR